MAIKRLWGMMVQGVTLSQPNEFSTEGLKNAVWHASHFELLHQTLNISPSVIEPLKRHCVGAFIGAERSIICSKGVAA